MPIDVGIAVENVGRLVDAVVAGECRGGFSMIPSIERRGKRLAEAEDAFKGFAGGGEGVERTLEAFEANDRAAMAFDYG